MANVFLPLYGLCTLAVSAITAIWPMYFSPFIAHVHWPFPTLRPFGQSISLPMRLQYIGRYRHFSHLANAFLNLCVHSTLAVTAISAIWPMCFSPYAAAVPWPFLSNSLFGHSFHSESRLFPLAICHDLPIWPMIRPKTSGYYLARRFIYTRFGRRSRLHTKTEEGVPKGRISTLRVTLSFHGTNF